MIDSERVTGLAAFGTRPDALEEGLTRGAGLRSRLLASWSVRIGAALMLLLTVAAVAGPLIVRRDPLAIEPAQARLAPSAAHLFGTDQLGRDLLARVVAGTRVSLSLAALTGVLTMAIGLLVGSAAGYVGGLVDAVLMRMVDLILAFPSVVLAIPIAGTLGAGYASLLIAMVVTGWARYARLIRGAVLAERARPYVEAARSLGATFPRLIGRHILPNVVWPFLVLLSLDMGRIVLLVAALDYLGVGVPPPTPEWGTMIADARLYIFDAPWMIIFPGIAIAVTVAGLNLFGEGLRDAVDPRASEGAPPAARRYGLRRRRAGGVGAP